MSVSLKELAEKINSFDHLYEYSDDHRVWKHHHKLKSVIKKELEVVDEAGKKALSGMVDMPEKSKIFKLI